MLCVSPEPDCGVDTMEVKEVFRVLWYLELMLAMRDCSDSSAEFDNACVIKLILKGENNLP